jgi:hypothetical protein
VVVEVVKLPEKLRAARVIAFQDLQAAVRGGVAILEDPEVSGVGGHQALNSLSTTPALGGRPLIDENLANLCVSEVLTPLEH